MSAGPEQPVPLTPAVTITPAPVPGPDPVSGPVEALQLMDLELVEPGTSCRLDGTCA